MNQKQLSDRIGNIDDRLIQAVGQDRDQVEHRRGPGRGLRRLAAIAAVAALMVCSFSLGAFAFAREVTVEVPVEVPVEQETIEIGDLGLTLILPDSWKGRYALERNADGGYSVYAPGIREDFCKDSERKTHGGTLFYITLWDEQLTKAQVDTGGEWNYARCAYIMTTKDGTYLLYYVSDLQFTDETMEEYRQMESEIANIRFVVDKALAD